MAVLLIIPVVTIGLGVYVRRWTLADSEAETGGDDTWLVDAFARTFVVVLISLWGLLVLGVLYGNVLGAVRAATGTF